MMDFVKDGDDARLCDDGNARPGKLRLCLYEGRLHVECEE